MIRMFGRMRKSLGWILLIVVLLLAQAYCDLALPACTSKIIDTGISQKGIEDAVPETIRDGSSAIRSHAPKPRPFSPGRKASTSPLFRNR